jgi:hypothetical protein
MEVTTESSPDGTKEFFSVTNLALRLAYGKHLTDRLRVGGVLKYIREDIFTAYMQSFVFDLGSNFNTGIYGIILGMFTGIISNRMKPSQPLVLMGLAR